MDLKRYEELKAKVDRARRVHDRAVGARDLLRKRLSDEHGCRSLAEADVELARLRSEAEGLKRRLAEKLAEFEDEWAETLEGRVR